MSYNDGWFEIDLDSKKLEEKNKIETVNIFKKLKTFLSKILNKTP